MAVTFTPEMRAYIVDAYNKLPLSETTQVANWFKITSASKWSGKNALLNRTQSAYQIVNLTRQLCKLEFDIGDPCDEIVLCAFQLHAAVLGLGFDCEQLLNNWVPTVLSDRAAYDRLLKHVAAGTPGYDDASLIVSQCSPKPSNSIIRRAVICLARLHVQRAMEEEKTMNPEPSCTIFRLQESIATTNATRLHAFINPGPQIKWAVYQDNETLVAHANKVLQQLGRPTTTDPYFAFQVMCELEFKRNRSTYGHPNWEAIPFIAEELLKHRRAILESDLVKIKAKALVQAGRAAEICKRLNMPDLHSHATQRAAYLLALRTIEHSNTAPEEPPQEFTPPQEEQPMSKPFETIDYVFGNKLEECDASQLMDAIRKVRKESAELKELEDTGSKHIENRIKELANAEKKIVKALDAIK